MILNYSRTFLHDGPWFGRPPFLIEKPFVRLDYEHLIEVIMTDPGCQQARDAKKAVISELFGGEFRKN